MTNIDKINSLLCRLDLPDAILCIIDKDTGAGYIYNAYNEDKILCRFNTYRQAISLLEAFLIAKATPNI